MTKKNFTSSAYDFGVKTNSLREFAKYGCRLTVVPAETSAEEVLELKPDGIFLSNGPGDPASMKKVVEEIKKLTESNVPMFGICLGHQILGQAFRRRNLQTAVRASRRQSADKGFNNRKSRNHLAQSRFCGRRRIAARRNRSNAHQSK